MMGRDQHAAQHNFKHTVAKDDKMKKRQSFLFHKRGTGKRVFLPGIKCTKAPKKVKTLFAKGPLQANKQTFLF
jgi:hypothetical protein